MQKPRLITLISDFGLADHYVAAMKAVLLSACPAAQLIDVTHQIPRHDILAGSFALERSLAAFAPKTAHLCVIDPGVGSDRRALLVEIAGQFVVLPDNGLITWAWHRLPGGTAREITWRPAQSSTTFHGRDLFAPIAGLVAAGKLSANRLGGNISPKLLAVRPTHGDSGQIIHIDHFGNATTNIVDDGRRDYRVFVKNKSLGRLKGTYSDVGRGKPLALIGSSGLLEIAVREGSAAEKLRLNCGEKVVRR
ncbi:MAG TPA: SAM-dependent chlorinase/fluorinase [Tepidisphaeraceae bacterium]|nr:SAM-dependent chlorinase/fluorinase [Tepidisphaeraceae bacterium]